MKTKPVPTFMFLVVEQLKLHKLKLPKKPTLRRLTYVIKILGQRQNRVTLGCKKPRFRFGSVSSTHRGFGSGFGYRNNTRSQCCCMIKASDTHRDQTRPDSLTTGWDHSAVV